MRDDTAVFINHERAAAFAERMQAIPGVLGAVVLEHYSRSCLQGYKVMFCRRGGNNEFVTETMLSKGRH